MVFVPSISQSYNKLLCLSSFSLIPLPYLNPISSTFISGTDQIMKCLEHKRLIRIYIEKPPWSMYCQEHVLPKWLRFQHYPISSQVSNSLSFLSSIIKDKFNTRDTKCEVNPSIIQNLDHGIILMS